MLLRKGLVLQMGQPVTYASELLLRQSRIIHEKELLGTTTSFLAWSIITSMFMADGLPCGQSTSRWDDCKETPCCYSKATATT